MNEFDIWLWRPFDYSSRWVTSVIRSAVPKTQSSMTLC